MLYRVDVDADGDHVHVADNLPADLRMALAVALAGDLDLDLLDLAKAKGDHGEELDPRFPELMRLLALFRSTWFRWAAWLARRLGREAQAPGTGLSTILHEHAVGVTAETTGTSIDPATSTALVRRGDLRPNFGTAAPIVESAATGLARDPGVPPLPGDPIVLPVVPPTLAQKGSVLYASERAAVFMRRPVAALHTALGPMALDAGVTARALSPAERQAMRTTIGLAVVDNITPKELAQRLRTAATGTSLTNDMERVARTELHFAHAHGAYVALKARNPGADPRVYKIVSPRACTHCRRIWGDPAKPIVYRLSEIEAHDAHGGNFHLPAAAWKATIGPLHPNCTCPPLLEWRPEVHDAVQKAAAAMRAVYGR